MAKSASEIMKEKLRERGIPPTINKRKLLKRLNEEDKKISRITEAMIETFKHIDKLVHHLAFFPDLSKEMPIAEAFRARYLALSKGQISQNESKTTIEKLRMWISNLRTELFTVKNIIKQHQNVDEEIKNDIERINGLIRIEDEEIRTAEADAKAGFFQERAIKGLLEEARRELKMAVEVLNNHILPMLGKLENVLMPLLASVDAYKTIVDALPTEAGIIRIKILATEKESNIPIPVYKWNNLAQVIEFEEKEMRDIAAYFQRVKENLQRAFIPLQKVKPEFIREIYTLSTD